MKYPLVCIASPTVSARPKPRASKLQQITFLLTSNLSWLWMNAEKRSNTYAEARLRSIAFRADREMDRVAKTSPGICVKARNVGTLP
jgi:hypothetical protein